MMAPVKRFSSSEKEIAAKREAGMRQSARGRGHPRAPLSALEAPIRGHWHSPPAACAGLRSRGRIVVRGPADKAATYVTGGATQTPGLPGAVAKSVCRCSPQVHCTDGRYPHSWLWLPDYFAEEMEEVATLGLWLQRDGCCYGPTWVAMEFNSLTFMFLGRGWKLFSLDRGPQE
ncbi:hypothetical protein D1007_26666 [Hordeum vulgare]|nr:hypothetical protein D1007_26666 [Hordeum vulgare]